MEKTFDFYDKTNLKSYNLNDSMKYELNMLSKLDTFTLKHSENVASIVSNICKQLKLNKDYTVYAIMCAYLHDIGKTFIPPEILQKNGKLTDEEREIMKTHTTLGYKVCIENPKLKPYADGTLYHHEALNGSGYPKGVTKEDIPLVGQIIRVADEFDAIVSKRQYKSHIDISDTLKILAEETIPSFKNNDTNVKNPKYSKINPQILFALFEVVINDTYFEINAKKQYIKHLENEVERINRLINYVAEYRLATKEKDKRDYMQLINYDIQDGENFDNLDIILKDIKNTLEVRKPELDKLNDEINKIKKIDIDFWL